MRITDFAGVYHMFEEISPEAFRAQRMAELEQIARYRAARMAEFKAWSDTQQRTQIQINSQVELAKAMAEVEGKTVWLRPRLRLEEYTNIVPIPRTTPKRRPWWARLFGC